MKKRSKGLLIGLLVAALVLVGGGASAFFLMNKSPKMAYFAAESETIQKMVEVFEDRYKNEVKWLETQEKKPVESRLTLSGESNTPDADEFLPGVQSILENSEVSIRNVYNPVKKELELELAGALGGVKLNAGKTFVTEEEVMVSLPFTDDILLLKDQDFGKLMSQFDENYEGQEELGLSKLFERGMTSSNELNTYFKEYLTYLVEKLPEEAFTKEKEEIDLDGKKVAANKLTMKLSEKEVKGLMKDLLGKIRDDKRMEELIKTSLNGQDAFSSLPGEDITGEFGMVFGNFKGEMNDIIEAVDELSLPGGIESTIWQDKNSIVKRDFAIAIGYYEGEEMAFNIAGTQLLEQAKQKWAYTFTIEDLYFEDKTKIEFTGDLAWDQKEAKDVIKLTTDEVEFYYEGKEKLDGKKRTFTRAVGYTDDYSSPALVWSGNATHESDSVKATHKFSIGDEDEAMYGLDIKQDSKVVKKVNLPSKEERFINLGEMDILALEKYLYEEFLPKFDEWSNNLIGDFESELSNY